MEETNPYHLKISFREYIANYQQHHCIKPYFVMFAQVISEVIAKSLSSVEKKFHISLKGAEFSSLEFISLE